MTKPKIILDCDPGLDDAIAILLAAQQTELLGITTVSGNAPLSYTTRNALLVTQLAGIDVDVHSGAERPLLIEAAFAQHVHGESGLDGPDLPDLEREAASADAVGFIIETVRSTDDVWLCPIGPMTNIALALRQAPDIAQRIAGISFMGGSTGPGNVTPAAEFNIWADPHAARMMIDAPVADVRMLGLNVTSQFGFGPDDALRFAELGSTTGVFASEVLTAYIEAARRLRSSNVAHLHDPCAILAITHPHLFESSRLHVGISTGSITAGMTVVDQRGRADESANVDVMMRIDAGAATEVLYEAIAAFP